MSNSSNEEEFQFLETSESKFYKNFLKKWETFYPHCASRQQRVEQVENVIEEHQDTKTEVQIFKDSRDEPKKIFDYKSKKYIKQ